MPVRMRRCGSSYEDIRSIDNYYRLQQKLADNSQIQDVFKRLFKRPVRGDDDEGEDSEVAAGAMTILQEYRSNIEEQLEDIPPLLRPTDASARKSLQVFGIPELLETILVNLSPEELWSAQYINKTFNAMVRTSLEIQRCVMLSPDKDAFLSVPHYIWPHGGY